MADEPDVATARWYCDATYAAVVRTTGLLGAFAGRHGMRPRTGEEVALAVSEVLAHAAGARRTAAGADRAVVEAATDGLWLTVNVSSRRMADDDGAVALATATALAERVEWDEEHGDGMRVLMEFRTGAQSDPAPARRRGDRVERRPACTAVASGGRRRAC